MRFNFLKKKSQPTEDNRPPKDTGTHIPETRSIGAQVAGLLNDFANYRLKFTRSRATDYIPIEGVVDSHTMFDGGNFLISVFKVCGSYNVVGAKESEQIIRDTVSSMASVLRSEGIEIQIVYSRDKRGSDAAVEQYLTPLRNKADSLNMDFDLILDENAEMLREQLTVSEMYVAVMTSPLNLLSKEAYKQAMKDIDAQLGPDFPQRLPEGMRYYRQPPVVRAQHSANIDSVRNILTNDWNVAVELLSVRDAIKTYRRMLFPEHHQPNWEPILPLFEETRGKQTGRYMDVNATRLGDHDYMNPKDLSHLMYRSIKHQIVAAPITRFKWNSGIAQFGNRFVGTYYMTTMPQEPKSFDNLLLNIPAEIPFRFSITLYGGAANYRTAVGQRKTGAYITSFFSKHNRSIARGCESLEELDDAGIGLAGCSIQIATWDENQTNCEENLRRLGGAIEKWGNCQGRIEFGDPALAFTAGLPGWSDQLREVLIHGYDYMLDSIPYKMLTSPWTEGTMAFVNEENRLFLYKPISDKQQTWGLLGFAPPGGGKSVWLNCLIRAALLDPTQIGFPKVCAIDIGNSLRGGIRLYKHLSKDKETANRFQHIEFEFSDRFRVNMFDLYAGCQTPLTHEISSMQSFLAFILTPVGEEAPLRGATELIKILLPETFKSLIDSPRLYDPYADQDLKEWVDRQPRAQARAQEGTLSWWSLELLAIEQGEYKIASSIHRFVSPNMRDIFSTLNNSHVIKEMFKDDMGRQMLVEAKRMIQTFMTEYPSLCVPSAFSFDLADICIIDLNKASPDRTPTGLRQTALAYMIARNMLSRGILLSRELMKEMPPEAVKVYKDDIERLDTVSKYFLYDELHRTSGIRMIEGAIVDDMRTGRKFRRFTGAFSQLEKDFTQDMIDTSSVRVVMRVDKAEEARTITDKYGWSESVYEALRRRVRGASGSSKGASFLFNGSSLLNLPEGVPLAETTQVLRSFVGPTELACYSTNRADAALLASVEELGVPYNEAVRLIGKYYGGSISSLVEKDMQKMRQSKQTDDEASQIKSMITPYINRIMQAYDRMHDTGLSDR